jgi:uncharacterized protein YdaU (DUF1376 family)
MSRAWMPLYWGDYLRDTRDLSTLQHGAYLLLMAHYWQHAALPDDEKQLAAIVGLSPKAWRKIAPPIAAKFQNDWRHKRIDAEIAKAERVLMQRRISGAKGGHRSAVTRSVALGSAIVAAQRRAQMSGPGAGRANASAIAAAHAQANGSAKSEQTDTNHNHNRNLSSSESVAARTREERPPAEQAEPPQGIRSKRPNELTRAEIDAIHARRRAGAPGDAP